MQKSKIVKILESFTQEDFKKFSAFLKSPFFNSNRTIVNFFHILQEYILHYDIESLTKEFIYKKLFPNSKFNRQVINNLASELLQLLKKYLGITFFREERSSDFDCTLLAELYDKKLINLFNSELKRIEKKYRLDIKFDEDFFYNNYRIQKIKEKYLYQYEKTNKLLKSENYTLQSEYILSFTIIKLLYYHIQYFIGYEAYNFKSDFDIINSFLGDINLEKVFYRIKENNRKHYNFIFIYYSIYKSFVHLHDEKYLNDSIKLLNENQNDISPKSIAEIYEILINCCVRKIRLGNSDILNILFNIYQDYLNKKIYKIRNDYLGPYRVRNIVWVAILLKEFDWAENFINKYVKDFTPRNEDVLYNYLISLVSFEKKEFEKALTYINKVNIETHSFRIKLDIKELLLRIYYELNYTDSAFASIDSYKHFLKNNKSITDLVLKFANNFITSMNKLIQAKCDPNNQSKLIQLRLLLQNLKYPGTPFKEWFLQKISELEQKNRRN